MRDFSQILKKKKLDSTTLSFQISLLQTPPAPPASPTPPAPPESSAPTGEAQAYIQIFIPDYCGFRLEQQLLGQRLIVFVCSEPL